MSAWVLEPNARVESYHFATCLVVWPWANSLIFVWFKYIVVPINWIYNSIYLIHIYLFILYITNCGAREDSWESPLEGKEIQPVNPKGNQSWIFIGRTDAKAKTPVLWPTDAKNWLIGKDPDVGKDWRQEEKVATEDEMAGWHRWLNGHEFKQAPGDGEGQGSLECCSPWGHKESRHDLVTEKNTYIDIDIHTYKHTYVK